MMRPPISPSTLSARSAATPAAALAYTTPLALVCSQNSSKLEEG